MSKQYCLASPATGEPWNGKHDRADIYKCLKPLGHTEPHDVPYFHQGICKCFFCGNGYWPVSQGTIFDPEAYPLAYRTMSKTNGPRLNESEVE